MDDLAPVDYDGSLEEPFQNLSEEKYDIDEDAPPPPPLPPEQQQPVKRGRGRPPKNPNEKKAKAPAGPPKPRGRPRKSDATPKGPPKPRGRPPKNPNAAAATKATPAKRPRGRPPKNSAGDASAPPAKRPRGRPPKNAGGAPTPKNAAEGSPTPKRRGRPPKNPGAAASSAKKPRGRPPKKAKEPSPPPSEGEEEDVEMEEYSPQPTKRPRGRPAGKSVGGFSPASKEAMAASKEEKEDVDDPTPVKRGRGRPRKSVGGSPPKKGKKNAAPEPVPVDDNDVDDSTTEAAQKRSMADWSMIPSRPVGGEQQQPPPPQEGEVEETKKRGKAKKADDSNKPVTAVAPRFKNKALQQLKEMDPPVFLQLSLDPASADDNGKSKQPQFGTLMLVDTDKVEAVYPKEFNLGLTYNSSFPAVVKAINDALRRNSDFQMQDNFGANVTLFARRTPQEIDYLDLPTTTMDKEHLLPIASGPDWRHALAQTSFVKPKKGSKGKTGVVKCESLHLNVLCTVQNIRQRLPQQRTQFGVRILRRADTISDTLDPNAQKQRFVDVDLKIDADVKLSDAYDKEAVRNTVRQNWSKEVFEGIQAGKKEAVLEWVDNDTEESYRVYPVTELKEISSLDFFQNIPRDRKGAMDPVTFQLYVRDRDNWGEVEGMVAI